MAMTLPTAEDLFEETVRKVSSTPQEWLKFLNTALVYISILLMPSL